MMLSAGTSITNSGLVFALDARNKKSYNPNLLTYGQTFNNGYWTLAAGLTIDSTTELAPDGTNTATILTDPGSSFSYVERNVTIPADTESYVLSFYLKKANSTIDVAMNARLLGGTEVNSFPRVAADGTGNGLYTLVDLGEWWRVHFTLTNNGTNTSLQYRFYPAARSTGGDDATVTGSNTVWGFMVTRGTELIDYKPNEGVDSSTWHDLSGNAYNCTLDNRVKYSNTSQAIQFRSTANMFGTATFDEGVLRQQNELGEWSIEVLFKQIGVSQASESIVAGRLGCHGGIYIYNNPDRLFHAVKTTEANCFTGSVNIQVTTLTTGSWYHSVMSYENGYIKHYVNGTNVSNSTFDRNTYNMRGYDTTFYVGGITSRMPNIDLSVVRAYSIALNDDQVVQNYAALQDRMI